MSAPYTQLYVHLVWATWERSSLITEEIELRLLGAMRSKCDELGCRLLAASAVPDHVHLLLRYPASVSISSLVGQLKGASSHLVTHELPGNVSFRWQGGYGAFSVSKRSIDLAAAYVQDQKRHHSEGAVYDDLERCEG